MAGRSKREPLAELADYEAVDYELPTSVTYVAPPSPTPDQFVRDTHAALRDAIAWARSAGYVVSGDLDRILISQTGRA